MASTRDAPVNGRPAVECVGVAKAFGEVRAVESLNLAIDKGQILVLLGPSGCGKTTALRLLSGFERPDTGFISIGGRLVAGPGSWEPPERRNVGMVFQDGALFPHLSVEQNAAYGLQHSPRQDAQRATRAQRRERTFEALRLVGLEELAARMPHELSGGQQQRLALARALAPGPEALLLDEPFSNLDPRLRDQVRRDVLDILRAANATAIFVTHDQEEALLLADVIAVMRQGRLAQVGPPEQVFHRPANHFVAEFIGVANFLPAVMDGAGLVTEIGVLTPDDALPHGAAAEVMLRPGDVSVRRSDSGTGQVVDRAFKGTHYLYSIAMPSGAALHSLQPHTAYFRKGDRVSVHLEPNRAVTAFIESPGQPEALGAPVLARTPPDAM